MVNKVALVKQPDYDAASLVRSIRRAIDLMEFDLSRVRGTTVLLKPNMVGAHPPSQGVTTHPTIVAAVGRIFKDAGAEVWVGDNPMGALPTEIYWKKTGIGEACRNEGLIQKDFGIPGSIERNGFPIAQAVVDADFVVNLPKFKTHLLTKMTLAVKNTFGCIPGDNRADYHKECPKVPQFCETLVRIAEAVKPDLNIIDGIVAMEGCGPTVGDTLNLSAIVAGTNAHAVDWACCTLIGLTPMQLETIRAAIRLGVWNNTPSVQMIGDSVETLRPEEFSIPYEIGRWWVSQYLRRLMWNMLSPQPMIDESKCRRCGLCVKSCPTEAISWENGERSPFIQRKLCIKCYCCSEICPHRAIALEDGLALRAWRLMNRA